MWCDMIEQIGRTFIFSLCIFISKYSFENHHWKIKTKETNDETTKYFIGYFLGSFLFVAFLGKQFVIKNIKHQLKYYPYFHVILIINDFYLSSHMAPREYKLLDKSVTTTSKHWNMTLYLSYIFETLKYNCWKIDDTSKLCLSVCRFYFFLVGWVKNVDLFYLQTFVRSLLDRNWIMTVIVILL